MTKTWHFAQGAVNGITKNVNKFQPLSLTTNIFVLGAANDLLLKLSIYLAVHYAHLSLMNSNW